MNITILLGGHLRTEALEGPQERSVTLPSGASVADAAQQIGLKPERVGMILLNGRAATLEAPLADNDRVGLFPPELRYNTFVSMYFRTTNKAAQGRGEPQDPA